MSQAADFRVAKPRQLTFECLEPRKVLSVVLDAPEIAFDDLIEGANGKGGGPPSAPAIDLATVALHELGHALGLPHSTSSLCGTSASVQPIMCAYYLGPSFTLKAEDIAKISTLYPDILNSDTDIVNDPTDARWDNPSITYSFMPDGSGMEQGSKGGSNLFATMDAKIGANWQSIFAQALSQWAAATSSVLKFTSVQDNGASFNSSGQSQGDARFGDIRFGGHKFDSVGNVLAHTYFPPPNGATAAGDSHYASEEGWKNLSGVALSANAISGGQASASTPSGGGASGSNASSLRGMDSQVALQDYAIADLFTSSVVIPGQSTRLTGFDSLKAVITLLSSEPRPTRLNGTAQELSKLSSEGFLTTSAGQVDASLDSNTSDSSSMAADAACDKFSTAELPALKTLT